MMLYKAEAGKQAAKKYLATRSTNGIRIVSVVIYRHSHHTHAATFVSVPYNISIHSLFPAYYYIFFFFSSCTHIYIVCSVSALLLICHINLHNKKWVQKTQPYVTHLFFTFINRYYKTNY